MRTIGKKLIVKFSETHLKEIKLGGVTLIRPDMWFDTQKEDGTTQFQSNENKLLTHPQIVSVILSNDDLGYKQGEELFVHYMAKEWEEKTIINNEEYSVIDAEYVLFRIIDGKYIPVKDVFLGHRLFTSELKLDSGLFLNVSRESIASKIKITHKPLECEKIANDIDIDDIVLTVDDNQYEISVDNDSYVKLTSDEIYAII